MYPRNAASPERLAIGAVVQISDGAVQTSGVSIKVKPQGASASAGAGTTSYEEGVVGYLPTQAETDYTSFQVIAYKTGCIPASVTVVTSASAVAGHGGIDWSKINAPTTAVNLSATNIDVDQVVASVSGAVGTVNALAANSVNASALASDAVSEIQSGLATAANLSTVAGYLDTEIAAILADTNELQTDWANGGRLDLILDARASQTSVDDLPTNAELATALGTADDATLAAIATMQGNVTDILADTADMQPKLGTPAGASISADIAAIEAQTDDIGTAGAGLSAIPWNPAWDAEVQSEVADALTASGLTAAGIADAVWEESLGDHSATSGSTAEALAAAGGAGDPWITPLPGSYTSGQAGKIVGDYLNAAVGDVPTNAELATALATADDAVLAAIGDLPTNSELATALGTADDAVLSAIGALPTAEENADALLNRDMSAVSDTNARSPLNALRFLRNKWAISGSTLSVKKEDDTTEAWNAAVSTTPGADPVTGNDPA